MDLSPITPYNIIEYLKKQNAELETQNAELREQIEQLQKEESSDTVANSGT